MFFSNTQEVGSKATHLFLSSAFISHEITGTPWWVKGKDVATALLVATFNLPGVRLSVCVQCLKDNGTKHCPHKPPVITSTAEKTQNMNKNIIGKLFLTLVLLFMAKWQPSLFFLNYVFFFQAFR